MSRHTDYWVASECCLSENWHCLPTFKLLGTTLNRGEIMRHWLPMKCYSLTFFGLDAGLNLLLNAELVSREAFWALRCETESLLCF